MNDANATGHTALDRLAALAGILPEYFDVTGVRHLTTAATKRALLAAMGVEATTDAQASAALADYQRRAWTRRLAPVAVFTEDEPALAIAVTLPAELAARQIGWMLTRENGEVVRGTLVPERSPTMAEHRLGEVHFVRYRFDLSAAGVAVQAGYHRFELDRETEAERAVMTLIVAPTRCYRPPALAGDGRVWGFAVQLPSLRSRRNWGSGDFRDLTTLIDFAADAGADVIGLNPLHALKAIEPERASPYSPSSRLFGNPLYLDIEAIAEFAGCEAARRAVAAPRFQARLRALRESKLVDFVGLAAAKREILELLYRCFRDRHRGTGDARDAAFEAFLAAGGEALRGHTLFDALSEKLRAEGLPGAADWRQWPERFRDAHGAGAAHFAAEHVERVEFHAYLQWQFEAQLDAAASRAAGRGLSVGLLEDLAVGIDAGGSERWSDPGLYASAAAVGAPPDIYQPAGQNWGLPPLIPDRLRDAAYAPFIATLRRNMRAAGALRIDHVMGLLRLYWVPDGAGAEAGAYVLYPFDDLLGVLALESQRNQCLVVGEDLGTVPSDVVAGMRRSGVLSLRPMYFESGPGGESVPPDRYLHEAVVSVGTHDLPTLRGYWQGSDLDVRHAIGQFAEPGALDAQRGMREADRTRLVRALEHEGLLAGIENPHTWSPALALSVHRFAARTPSKVLLVAMEDVFGQVEQINLPGTIDEHPNWRRKLERELEEWPRDPDVRALIEALERERPSPRPKMDASVPRRQPHGEAPRATYRLQLNREFTFADATALVPYLAALGVSHVYLSPYFKARPGSLHGYDIVDHNVLNPEIGDRAALDRLCAVLREHGMAQLVDIVPNHVGVLGAENPWWQDVLENGRAALHADFFDIDWDRTPDELHGKLLIPVLGEPYGTVLERGGLQLAFEPARGEFALRYGEHRFPLDPRSYSRVLDSAVECVRARVAHTDPGLADAFESLGVAFRVLPKTTETAPVRRAERQRDQALHKSSLAELCARSPEVVRCVEEEVGRLNGQPRDPASFDALHALIDEQVFRLASWRMAADDINYRRFADVNDLAALRMEDPAVFEASHRLLLELIEREQVGALRVDHPDGLCNPEEYFARLQRHAGQALRLPYRDETDRPASAARGLPLYLVIEKITEASELLPRTWPIAGTTGYGFANLVKGLFIDARAEAKLTRGYFAFLGERPDFEDMLYRSKRLVMLIEMASELNALASALSRIAQADRATRDFTYSSLRAALAEVIACFPVYRTYVTAAGISEEDRRFIDQAIRAARRRALAAEASVFVFLRNVLTTDLARARPEAQRAGIVRFAMRFQQYTGPIMAKGMEDTAFYRYNRLLSQNEVGGDLRHFGVSVAAFHEANARRAREWPHAMLATSTHDTKRSEDVRTRLDVLSEVPGEWRLFASRWHRLSRAHKLKVDEAEAPTRNDEYLIYQTLLGTWPDRYDDPAVASEFAKRIERYLIKVVREAKVVSSWVNPNEAYERAVIDFLRALLTSPGNEPFLADFIPFQRKVAWFGILNSLAQTLLKLTAPGVPDIYQGCEWWNLSLVDPDNRRPVDFAARQEALAAMQAAAVRGANAVPQLAADLASHPDDGRLKQFVIWRTLGLRRARDALFRDGEYLPLQVTGERAEHVCAFARVSGDDCAVAIAPRLTCTLLERRPGILPIGPAVWGDTAIDVSPLRSPQTWDDALTGAPVDANGARLPLAVILDRLPVALLAARTTI